MMLERVSPTIDLKSLIGKHLKRADVFLKVGCVSIRDQVYVHAAGLDSFGWTFINLDGTMCGDWFVSIETEEVKS